MGYIIEQLIFFDYFNTTFSHHLQSILYESERWLLPNLNYDKSCDYMVFMILFVHRFFFNLYQL
jgi:hypothetical protein